MTAATRTGVEERTREKRRLAPLYKVLLHNDDFNAMDYVCGCLARIFSIGQREAWRIMLEAHHRGLAICRVEPLETAELHRDQLQSSGLTSTIEPDRA